MAPGHVRRCSYPRGTAHARDRLCFYCARHDAVFLWVDETTLANSYPGYAYICIDIPRPVAYTRSKSVAHVHSYCTPARPTSTTQPKRFEHSSTSKLACAPNHTASPHPPPLPTFSSRCKEYGRTGVHETEQLILQFRTWSSFCVTIIEDWTIVYGSNIPWEFGISVETSVASRRFHQSGSRTGTSSEFD